MQPLWVAAHQQKEIEWASMDEVDVEDFDLSNITDDENANEFGTSVFDTEKVDPIWSDETEDWVYWQCSIS